MDNYRHLVLKIASKAIDDRDASLAAEGAEHRAERVQLHRWRYWYKHVRGVQFGVAKLNMYTNGREIRQCPQNVSYRADSFFLLAVFSKAEEFFTALCELL